MKLLGQCLLWVAAIPVALAASIIIRWVIIIGGLGWLCYEICDSMKTDKRCQHGWCGAKIKSKEHYCNEHKNEVTK